MVYFPLRSSGMTKWARAGPSTEDQRKGCQSGETDRRKFRISKTVIISEQEEPAGQTPRWRASNDSSLSTLAPVEATNEPRTPVRNNQRLPRGSGPEEPGARQHVQGRFYRAGRWSRWACSLFVRPLPQTLTRVYFPVVARNKETNREQVGRDFVRPQ